MTDRTLAPATPESRNAEIESAFRGPEAGFSLVEVVVAVLILAVGLLAMAGTTANLVQQTLLADLASERSAAVQSTVERLRSLPYDSLSAGTDSIGSFAVSWTSEEEPLSKRLEIVSRGPGRTVGAAGQPFLSHSVPDTFTYRIIRP